MSYLETFPRRLVTTYMPLGIIMFVLLFPFYWMALTSVKPNAELLDLDKGNPFWTGHRRCSTTTCCCFETKYPTWLWNTMIVAIASTILSLIASVFAAYAIVRLRYKGCADRRRPDLPCLSCAAVDSVHPPLDGGLPVRPVRHAVCSDPDLSDDPHPVLDLAPDGLLQDHPLRA